MPRRMAGSAIAHRHIAVRFKYLTMAASNSFQEGILGADLESDDDSSSEEEEDETVPPTQPQDMETMATQDFH